MVLLINLKLDGGRVRASCINRTVQVVRVCFSVNAERVTEKSSLLMQRLTVCLKQTQKTRAIQWKNLCC